ncbi:MAG: deoxyribonuclease IV [SAR324 cluster bacterium]|nr:deoxyribonuclease IV [SAR324 cluster bacterium]
MGKGRPARTPSEVERSTHQEGHGAAGGPRCLETEPGDAVTVIENPAGQGSKVGETLEDLAALLELIDAGPRTGVCLDTGHLFAAGYDFRSEEARAELWEQFERKGGRAHLRAFHVNDAKGPHVSRVDRHEAQGEGCIGTGNFERVARDPRFRGIPMFLGTPGGGEVWSREVAMLRKFRAEAEMEGS